MLSTSNFYDGNVIYMVCVILRQFPCTFPPIYDLTLPFSKWSITQFVTLTRSPKFERVEMGGITRPNNHMFA